MFRRKEYGTRLRGLGVLSKTSKRTSSKVVGCALDAEGENKMVRYYVNDDSDQQIYKPPKKEKEVDMDDISSGQQIVTLLASLPFYKMVPIRFEMCFASQQVVGKTHTSRIRINKFNRVVFMIGVPGPRPGNSNAPSSFVKIRSVTKNLSQAYERWLEEYDLNDHGLIAFHAKDLIKEMTISHKKKTDGKNDKEDKKRVEYYDLPANHLKPFATIDNATRDSSSMILSELLIDQWGLDPPRTIIT